MPLPGDDFVQRVVVCRHANREDHQHPKEWFGSPEGIRHPYDTPITREGEDRARGVGEKAPDAFDVIVCSPYMRCIMTGCEIARVKKIPIMFDNCLGEVFDDTYMPLNTEGKKQIRRPKALGDFLKREYPDVKAVGHDRSLPFLTLYGQHPVFPEDWRQALVRFDERFDYILTECARRRLNPILVTHADAVVNLFENITGSYVENADYCAWFVGERHGGTPESIWCDGWKWEVGDFIEHKPTLEVPSFEPIKHAIQTYRDETRKASVPYPELVFPHWLQRKNSEDEKIAEMSSFWTPARRTTIRNEEDHRKHLTMKETVHLVEAMHLLQRQNTDRSGHSPDLPEGVMLDIDSDEDDEVLFKSKRSPSCTPTSSQTTATPKEPNAVRM